jgi:thioredoxin-like negative regulator of GroEL
VTATPHKVMLRWSRIAILAAVGLIVVVLVTAKAETAGPSPSRGPIAGVEAEAPEVTLDRALAAGQPTLAFFHSLTCESCIEMTAIVGQVYPAFRGKVTLVDVNVYDDRNAALLSRARIVSIPTLVLVDRGGKIRWFPGVMDAAQLSQRLQALADGS